MLILAALFLVGVTMEFCACMAAPFGYQDESGFHAGFKQSGNDSNRAGTSPR
jgi:hypothetical protein